MSEALKTIWMGDLPENVIHVPFRQLEDIYMCHAAGAHVETLAKACRTRPSVIETMIKFQRRKTLRTKYLRLGLKGPA
jgi:hypothetical protein